MEGTQAARNERTLPRRPTPPRDVLSPLVRALSYIRHRKRDPRTAEKAQPAYPPPAGRCMETRNSIRRCHYTLTASRRRSAPSFDSRRSECRLGGEERSTGTPNPSDSTRHTAQKSRYLPTYEHVPRDFEVKATQSPQWDPEARDLNFLALFSLSIAPCHFANIIGSARVAPRLIELDALIPNMYRFTWFEQFFAEF
ncbi:hypothetical protein M569_10513 [Genlisea aurea]|uniref:Uncharacterized protein n=1 Tax=Genlisea aurea TaxID=192259 RepID=S8DMQ2_9LAMI|nr:hypothetical protein M569_10513 [Genlisea aurea]